MASTSNFYDLSFVNNRGETVSLADYSGKPILVVNTASKCGLTPQYEGLQKLHEEFRDQGLIVLGFPCNQFANQENQPGAGNDNGGRKRQSNLPSATFENLMKEYKSFIGESKEEMDETAEDDDMEEGIEDRLKDLDPKNPVNIPAYKRKAASGDSASAAKNTKESMNESIDILKLAGLRRL
jgi:hypothetical protein